MKKMKEWLDPWGALLAIIATVAGGVWFVASEIADVRTDLSAEINRIEVRLASVEAKLDLLIERNR